MKEYATFIYADVLTLRKWKSDKAHRWWCCHVEESSSTQKKGKKNECKYFYAIFNMEKRRKIHPFSLQVTVTRWCWYLFTWPSYRRRFATLSRDDNFKYFFFCIEIHDSPYVCSFRRNFLYHFSLPFPIFVGFFFLFRDAENVPENSSSDRLKDLTSFRCCLKCEKNPTQIV